MSPKDDITLKTILEHMRAMEDRIMGAMGALETRLGQRINTLGAKVDLLSTQIANIDARLDDLEVVQVPKLKKAVGMSGN